MENIEELLSDFKKEIDTLAKKKHKTAEDITNLNNSLTILKKRQAELNLMISKLLSKGSRLGSKHLKMKDKLAVTSEKLSKLRMLYEDLKEV